MKNNCHQLGSLPKDVQESDFADFIKDAREQRKKFFVLKTIIARKAGTNQKLITKLTERQKWPSYLKFFHRSLAAIEARIEMLQDNQTSKIRKRFGSVMRTTKMTTPRKKGKLKQLEALLIKKKPIKLRA